MRVKVFLIVNNKGVIRTTRNPTAVKPNEIGMMVTLDVPDAFFKRPTPSVHIAIPAGMVEQLTPEASVELSAEAVAQALGVSVEEARDGLTDILDNHRMRDQ